MDYRERWELKEYRYSQRLRRRILVLHAALLALLVGYGLGFYYLQVVRGDEYALLAENNRLRRVPLPPMRGTIFDRNGEVLASTRPSMNLVLRREGLREADAQLRRLEGVLGVPYATLRARLDRMRDRPPFEPLVIREDVSLWEVAKIESRREWFPSVEVEQVPLRSYPAGPAVAHVIGYVGEVSEAQLATQGPEGPLQPGDLVGKTGIERALDERLRGQRGWKLVTVNSLGRQFGEARIGQEPVNGAPLRTTLDVRLQRALVEALGEEAGAGVFMDPRTGGILALASTPAFDPNLFASPVTPDSWRSLVEDPRRPLHDRAIASFYAPGSTFKVILSVAGVETGTISPAAVRYCSGSIVLYGRPFLCWKKGGHGAVDLERALVHSCNVYFYQLGKALGIEAIARYADLFNLGRPTGVELPGESGGVLPGPEWKRKRTGEPWYAGETISVSIGQGVLAVTPLQMATMISAVATGGFLPRPHVCADVAPAPVKLPLADDTLGLVRRALQQVVEAGTGRRAALGPIPVAGKTGTAQVFKRSAGIDADELPKHERDHAWFVGYAPADRPEIAFAVVVEHGGHGGTAAAPIARRVLEVFFADRLPEREPSPALIAAAAFARSDPAPAAERRGGGHERAAPSP